MSVKIQSADAKKVLGSVRQMSLGCNVVVLDGGKNYTQNERAGQQTTVD